MGSALQLCTLGLRGDFLEGAFHLLQMQSQRVLTGKQRNFSSEPSAGWCLCRCVVLGEVSLTQAGKF